jgi:hypothetical protein
MVLFRDGMNGMSQNIEMIDEWIPPQMKDHRAV